MPSLQSMIAHSDPYKKCIQSVARHNHLKTRSWAASLHTKVCHGCSSNSVFTPVFGLVKTVDSEGAKPLDNVR